MLQRVKQSCAWKHCMPGDNNNYVNPISTSFRHIVELMGHVLVGVTTPIDWVVHGEWMFIRKTFSQVMNNLVAVEHVTMGQKLLHFQTTFFVSLNECLGSKHLPNGSPQLGKPH